MLAPATMSQAELIRKMTSAIRLRQRETDRPAVDERRASELPGHAAIRPSDADVDAVERAAATADRRSRGTSGPLEGDEDERGQEDPDGRHERARRARRDMKPMNVAVVKTGPGVTWPTAMASSSCASVSQPSRSTRSARRNASST